MATEQEYEVKLDQYEGPLDLLLYLVAKAEVEITAISVAHVTKQYLEYLEIIRELNIDVAAEYLHMAATLLRLKARELLPHDPQQVEEGPEGDIYTREQLIQQLLEYKKYKEAAGALKGFESQRLGTFSRGIGDEFDTEAPAPAEGIGNITIFDLLTAFKRVLVRVEEDPGQHVVVADDVRIDDRIDRILSMIGEGGETRLEELFADDKRRLALVATFIAILELIKMQELWFRQEEGFGTIYVSRRQEKEREGLVVEHDEIEGPTDGREQG